MKKRLFPALILGLTLAFGTQAQQSTRPLTEDDFYQLTTLPIPEDVVLEVGGLAPLPDGRLAVATRRGDIWIISNPYMTNGTRPHFTRFASGMHEVLGLAYHDGAFYCTQRGELTKLTDEDGDGRADRYEPITLLPITGNYHEYSYGPLFDKNGDMYVSLNVAWVGYGASLAKWRGWLIKVKPDGRIEPIAAGLRSPAGITINSAGDVFYGENQGDWVGSGKVTHLAKGDFAGHAQSLKWSGEPDSPIKLRFEEVPNTGAPVAEEGTRIPGYKFPAVWFPHSLMGISTSDIIEDQTGGQFGPFAGQYFVADQGHSKVMRMYLEKVGGQYQGACFPFREGWASGLLRLRWGQDGSLFGGMTSRGWSSTGKSNYAVQRLAWTGQMPFEMKTLQARPDGFLVEFTKPVDPATAADTANYQLTSFTYKYHSNYGSPIINGQPARLRGVIVAPDGLSARLVVEGTLREKYIYEVKAEGLKAQSGEALLHPVGYYTLNAIPAGERAALPAAPRSTAAAQTAHAGHTMPQPSTRQSAETVRATKASMMKRLNEMPVGWGGPDQIVTIGTKPGLKFDVETVQVKAGSKVQWVFNNNDDMTHNCVIVAPGSADDVGMRAINLGLKGSELNYVPNTPKVLFHTGLLQPESSETIYFTAPTQPGEYVFVCTYPGHHTVMQGKLKVVK
jgi:azurin/glucose/arabinose dehydrogenase